MAFAGHTPEGEKLHEDLMEKFGAADRLHKVYRQRWEHFYALYRGFTDWKSSVKTDTPRDVYDGLREAQRAWGAELFIPRTFSAVETIVPRVLSNRPRMLVEPRRQEWTENARAMRSTIDAQQGNIDYELKLQETVKTAEILGLGVQKVAWCRLTRKKRSLQKPTAETQTVKWIQGAPEDHVIFDDPDVWDVDPFDWFWDPYASSLFDLRYCFHRTWRDTEYVMGMLERGMSDDPATAAGGWKPLTVAPLSEEDVRGSASQETYDAVMAMRRQAALLGRYETSQDKGMHEILEFHDGERVVTFLDRMVAVNKGDNPAWHGEVPFSIYRPSLSGTKQLPGIGAVEPNEDLQLELNARRSQRLDNATMKLNAPLVFWEGKIVRTDLKWGPGMAIPAKTNPDEAIKQLLVGDIPGSAYQETNEIGSDMERTSGISDPVTGADVGASETATGVQLVQAAANIRIANQSRRGDLELSKRNAHLFGELNQQHIIEEKEYRGPALPAEPGDADRRYTWFVVDPTKLKGEFDYDVEGGSTAPENTAQMRADVQTWVGLLGTPLAQFLNMERIVPKVVELMGVENPEGYVQSQEQQLPKMLPEAMQHELEQMGLSPETAQQVVQHAMAEAVRAEQAPAPGEDPNAPAGDAPPQGPPEQGAPPVAAVA